MTKITSTTEQQTPHNVLQIEQLLGKTDSHIHWINEKVGVHHKMLAAYQQMQAAAEQDNITLRIASGYRDFDRQLAIWNNKYLANTPVKDQAGNNVDLTLLTASEKINAISLYSALPGASRHHWGTDIDVYAPNLLPKEQSLQLEPWEYAPTGPFATLTRWLEKYSEDFGFYFPYDTYRQGIAAEPWHLSYFPLANSFEQQLNVEVLACQLSKSAIEGKAEIIHHLDYIYKQFVTNINHTVTKNMTNNMTKTREI